MKAGRAHTSARSQRETAPVPAAATALVVAGHGRHYLIEDHEGHRRTAHPRGKKSDCVVGDRVQWRGVSGMAPGDPDMTPQDEAVIEALLPRRNLLFRQDEWRTKSFAANLDQVLVLLASDPVFSESLLARAVIAASLAGIDLRIGLNKADLDTHTQALARLAPYAAMGVEVMRLSLKRDTQASRDALTPWLQGRATLVLGPSGTGKSTLINAMVPSAQAQVGEISQALGSGRHTTTSTRWYWVDRNTQTALIDSPGFQSFGLRQVSAQDLAAHMPDIGAASAQCRFHNCTHRQEPGCGVLAAVAQGSVAPTRLRIYLELFEELSAQRW